MATLPGKPRHISGYKSRETEQVKSACLTVAVTLGALMDDLCIVGGLVPTLLIDLQYRPVPGTDDTHAGTNDLDIGLALALLEGQQYSEISRRLRQEGFTPDKNDRGNPTPQRWKLGDLNVTIDFLLPPISGADRGGRIHNLEGDFAALIAPGLQLAFDERHTVGLEGCTLTGEAVRRAIPVCGPAAFVVLKSFAFAHRAEPKDAYDLVYVLRRWPGGTDGIVPQLAQHAARHPEIVRDALTKLATDFAAPETIGPRRAAAFEGALGDDLDAAAADAHGYVDDLLGKCRRRDIAFGNYR